MDGLNSLLRDLDSLGVYEEIDFNAKVNNPEIERKGCQEWNDHSDGLKIIGTEGKIKVETKDSVKRLKEVGYSILFGDTTITLNRTDTNALWFSDMPILKPKEGPIYFKIYLRIPKNKEEIKFEVPEDIFLEAFDYYGTITEAMMEIAEHRIGGWLRNRGGRKGDGLGKLLRRYQTKSNPKIS